MQSELLFLSKFRQQPAAMSHPTHRAKRLARADHPGKWGEALQVAFTYTEPLTWYEYVYDFACLAPDVDIVLVSNGFINPEPLEKLLPFIKAMNIDLKSIRDEFYH